MTARRWLLALVVATGLLAMHGITASAASAAAPCGVTLPHEHHPVPPSDDLPTAQTASAVEPLVGHAGALCLAILVAGLVAWLVDRRTRGSGHVGPGRSAGPAVALTGRAPPDTLLTLLCVSRT